MKISKTTEKLARIIVLMEWMQRGKDRARLAHQSDVAIATIKRMNVQYNVWGCELTKLNHDHDVIAAIAEARKPR